VSERNVGPASPESGPFWEATRERRLVLQWCTACEEPIQYPRSFCPRCQASGSSLEWRDASGLGVVYAIVVEHKPEAMGEESPYAVALVDLEEGVRLMTNIVGPDALSATISTGVRVTWEPLEDGRHLPLFEVSAAKQV
jgi:hypothetical protein